MMKFAMIAVAAVTLSACVDGGGASVARMDTLSSNCPSQHMQTMNGLPMRCGPQVASPYSFQ